jgi:hypothetical protein
MHAVIDVGRSRPGFEASKGFEVVSLLLQNGDVEWRN